LSTVRPAVLAALAAAFVVSSIAPPAWAGENPFKKTEEPIKVAPAQPAPPKPVPKPAPKTAPRPAAGRGAFKVRYGPVGTSDYAEIQKVFRETHILEDTAKDLNATFILPVDVTIAMNKCGQANAFYESDKKLITLCYELIDQFSDIFLADATSDEEQETAGEAIAGAAMFTLYHELGHALIDLYDLPVTGREEDAVDQLATIILLEGGDEGEAAAINGATAFMSEDTEEEEKELEEISYWDEHSLGPQRFYNILCWTYGKNPEGNQDMVDDETLPADRAARCPAEYAQMSKSWDALLSAHMQ
jgi:hypothetical protein